RMRTRRRNGDRAKSSASGEACFIGTVAMIVSPGSSFFAVRSFHAPFAKSTRRRMSNRGIACQPIKLFPIHETLCVQHDARLSEMVGSNQGVAPVRRQDDPGVGFVVHK